MQLFESVACDGCRAPPDSLFVLGPAAAWPHDSLKKACSIHDIILHKSTKRFKHELISACLIVSICVTHHLLFGCSFRTYNQEIAAANPEFRHLGTIKSYIV